MMKMVALFVAITAAGAAIVAVTDSSAFRPIAFLYAGILIGLLTSEYMGRQ